MKKETLDNGLRIIFDENKNLKSASLSVFVASGSRFEREADNGISHFIEHMVFKGTKTLSAFDIAAKTDRAGAQLNAYTTKEYTCFFVKALEKEIYSCADILFDMLTQPLFDENDLATEKEVVLEEIAMYEDDPSDVCFSLMEKTLMPSHPLGMEILGTKENIESMTADALRAHMARFYVPERMVIAISGNYDEKALTDKIRQTFGTKINTRFPVQCDEPCLQQGFAVKKRTFEQSQLILAFPAVGSESAERFALQVLVTMLGSSSSSRLNQRLREQLGLVYSVDAWLSQAVGTGFLGISLALTPAKEDEALRQTRQIIENFADSITDDELQTAKQKVKSSLLMSREMPHSRLSANGYTVVMRDCFTDDEEIIRSIDALTKEKARELSKKYFDMRRVSFAACGKVKKAPHYQQLLSE